MRLHALTDVEGYDAVFVSPHVGDVPLACGARLLAEAGARRRVLLVVVCGEPSEAVPGTGWPAALERWRIDLLALRQPAAAERDPAYGSLRGVAFERRACDDAALAALLRLFEELRPRARARDVYLPLAVGGHADHRLTCEAGLRAFIPGEGRNVFLYEDRPAVLLPGALRLRLGQLGAWLPPGTPALDELGLARLLLRAQRESLLGCSPCEWAERVRCSPLLARQWRAMRAWRPQRGRGPRLQPVLDLAEGAAAQDLDAIRSEWDAHRPAGAPAAERLARLGAEYARRLGGEAHAERYWLLLPPRDEEARFGPLGRLADEAVAS